MHESDILIIGAGPAGLSAAIYAGRAAGKVTILEKAFPGGQVATTAAIGNYPGFPDDVDGMDLAEKMRTQAERFAVEFVTDQAETVKAAADGKFEVVGANDRYHAPAVIVATGSSYLTLNVPGEERLRGRGVSYCGTCDGPFFKGKRLVVVGGGDSAQKESLHLTHFASHIRMAVRKGDFKHGEGIYRRQIGQNDKIEVAFNTVVEEILGGDKVEGVRFRNAQTSALEDYPVDGVFVFIGSRPNSGLLSELLGIEAGDQVETNHNMATRIPGLFAVGDIRLYSYRQVATAVGEGATAALAAGNYLLKRSFKVGAN